MAFGSVRATDDGTKNVQFLRTPLFLLVYAYVRTYSEYRIEILTALAF
jgi:hypothetical protein